MMDHALFVTSLLFAGCLAGTACGQVAPGSPQSSAAAFFANPGGAAEPGFGVYRWGAANKAGGAQANEVYAKWITRSVVWAEDFEPNEHWENGIEGGGWQLGEWSNWKKAVPARRLILSVPLLPGGWDRSGANDGAEAHKPVSWEAAARGEYTSHFTRLAENLVKYGLGDSIVRLGWEFNGGWYTWRASDSPKDFAKYWGLIVTAMRAVPGTSKMQFCWNPASSWLQFPADQAWPGDEFVDIVGVDLYDQSWGPDTYPFPANATPQEIERRQRKAWNDVLLNGSYGIMSWKKFAEEHHKPFAFPEWGVCTRDDGHGGMDNPFFVEQMCKFIRDPANHVAFHCYFDVWAGDGNHQLSPGIKGEEVTKFPLSAAKFRQLFGGGRGNGTAASDPGSILNRVAAH